MTNITAPRFTNEDKAREHLEALRWPEGPFCPRCGSFDAKRLPAQRGRPTKTHPEGAIRNGVIQCNDCRKQYSVTVGTVYESSKIPLHKWLLANHLLCASKKGMSAHQLHRMLGITYKSAWFMFHRIREAMISMDTKPMGGNGLGDRRNQVVHGVHKKSALPGCISLTMVRWDGPKRTQDVPLLQIHELAVALGALAQEAWSISDAYGLWKFGPDGQKDGGKQFAEAKTSFGVEIMQQVQGVIKRLFGNR